MTLQDDLAVAFVAGMRDVVHGLSQEDPVSHHLEEPVGQGWAESFWQLKPMFFHVDLEQFPLKNK